MQMPSLLYVLLMIRWYINLCSSYIFWFFITFSHASASVQLLTNWNQKRISKILPTNTEQGTRCLRPPTSCFPGVRMIWTLRAHPLSVSSNTHESANAHRNNMVTNQSSRRANLILARPMDMLMVITTRKEATRRSIRQMQRHVLKHRPLRPDHQISHPHLFLGRPLLHHRFHQPVNYQSPRHQHHAHQ